MAICSLGDLKHVTLSLAILKKFGHGASHPVLAQAVISDSDIFHAARLVIDQHGEDAAVLPAARADQLIEDGDLQGSVIWRRTVKAIEELQRGRQETALTG